METSVGRGGEVGVNMCRRWCGCGAGIKHVADCSLSHPNSMAGGDAGEKRGNAADFLVFRVLTPPAIACVERSSRCAFVCVAVWSTDTGSMASLNAKQYSLSSVVHIHAATYRTQLPTVYHLPE